jgi:HEAT repeat protein
MVIEGTDKLICDGRLGFCAQYDLAADPRERHNLADKRPERTAALRQRLDEWLEDQARFEPALHPGLANPEGGAVPRSIERGRLGDIGAVGELAALLRSDDPPALRREAARLLVTALPPRREAHAALLAVLAEEGLDPDTGAWAAVAAARLGEAGARDRLRPVLGEAGPERRELRVYAAIGLAHLGDVAAVPVLAEALDRDQCGSVETCRHVIIALGRLRDRRGTAALIAHLPEVVNRREMVEALGVIGDPAAVPALGERLEKDEYVPVRAEAARALGLIGGEAARVALARAVRREAEASVLAAIQAAAQALGPAEVNAPASTPRSSAGTARSPGPERGR